MKNNKTQQEVFDKLLSDLDSDIVANLLIGMRIQDSLPFVSLDVENFIIDLNVNTKYKIGTFNGKDVFVDANMQIKDLRIFNSDGVELLDLSKFGFNEENLI